MVPFWFLSTQAIIYAQNFMAITVIVKTMLYFIYQNCTYMVKSLYLFYCVTFIQIITEKQYRQYVRVCMYEWKFLHNIVIHPNIRTESCLVWILEKCCEPIAGIFSVIFCSTTSNVGAHSGAVGWGNALQARRSQVRFPMVPSEIFIDIILPATLRTWGRLSL